MSIFARRKSLFRLFRPRAALDSSGREPSSQIWAAGVSAVDHSGWGLSGVEWTNSVTKLGRNGTPIQSLRIRPVVMIVGSGEDDGLFKGRDASSLPSSNWSFSIKRISVRLNESISVTVRSRSDLANVENICEFPPN